MRTIQTISEFKKMSTMTHDNRKNASENWAKSWGMTYWGNVWFYKEYSYMSLKYRSGQVIQRHTKSSVVKYYLGDKEISKKEFFELANTIEYRPTDIEIAKVKPQPKPKPQAKQLSLFD